MSETGTGRRRKAAIEDLRVHLGSDEPTYYRPATLADLISVLEGLGAEKVTFDTATASPPLLWGKGSYIVWRIEEE